MSNFLGNGLVKNYLAGQWVEGDASTHIGVEDPALEENVADCALAGEATLAKALDAARNSVERGDLSNMLPGERARLLIKIAQEIRNLADEGAPILCRESGKTLNDAHGEFSEAAKYFEYYAGVADKIEGKTIPLGPDYIDYTIYEPYGVSAQIVPWNFPVSLAARSLAPAMAAGNASILKSPELDPLAMAMLGKALEAADVPKGAVSILNGMGPELGAKLVASSQIDQIVFTGSVTTGQTIMRAAADNVVPSLMELGGKSAGIVFADADLDKLMDSVKWGIFFNAGQVCSAMSRLLVERSIYNDVVARCVTLAEGMSVGHGLDNPDHIPVISSHQLNMVEKITSTARQDGAKIATGGARLDRKGHFMAPTILADVDPNSKVAQTEIFGPVLCITPFDDENEAISMANGTEYGLVAGLFTRDLVRTHKMAAKLRGGQIYVNEWFAGSVATPFGGVGKSGFGREKGLEALYNYVRTKNIAISLR